MNFEALFLKSRFLPVLQVMLAGFLFLFISHKSLAQPYLYTFEGTVTNLYDYAGIADIYDVEVGDDVSYTYLVDQEAPAQATLNNGVTYTWDGNAFVDYFYSELVAGGLLDAIDEGVFNRPWQYDEINVGTEIDIGNFDYTSLQDGNLDNVDLVYSYESDPWDIGSVWNSLEMVLISELDETTRRVKRYITGIKLTGLLTLTEVAHADSGTHSVPEINAASASMPLALLISTILLFRERRRKITAVNNPA